MPVCRIDDILINIKETEIIVLMDIEGGELSAMRGGCKFLKTKRPLIIFEYNLTSKKYFNLKQMRAVLVGYSFYKLQSYTGKLDLNLADTWNVVAIPEFGSWASLRKYKDLFA